ncbi:MAG: SPW repeat protein [Actinomycetota bacterium]|nr:SPW repeat protein [Actinomycetota bacterium]
MTTTRVIPTQVHAVLDYLTGGALVAAPRLLGLTGTTAGKVLDLAGGIATAQSLLTDYELGLVKAIPMRSHLALDAASGAIVAASPWLFGFAGNGRKYWLPHVIVGATEILAAATTKTR